MRTSSNDVETFDDKAVVELYYDDNSNNRTYVRYKESGNELSVDVACA